MRIQLNKFSVTLSGVTLGTKKISHMTHSISLKTSESRLRRSFLGQSGAILRKILLMARNSSVKEVLVPQLKKG